MKQGRADLRYAAFAREYARTHNATQSAIKAGYSSKTAASLGSRLLRNVKVAEMVQALEREASELAQIDTVRLLRESARLAFVDPRRLFHPDGRPKAPHELDDDTAAAVAGIERVVEYKEVPKKKGKGTRKQRVVVFRYKVLDKNSTHERLFKHKGLFKEAPPPLPGDLEEGEENALDIARRIAFVLVVGAREKERTGKRK